MSKQIVLYETILKTTIIIIVGNYRQKPCFEFNFKPVVLLYLIMHIVKIMA